MSISWYTYAPIPGVGVSMVMRRNSLDRALFIWNLPRACSGFLDIFCFALMVIADYPSRSRLDYFNRTSCCVVPYDRKAHD